MITAGALDPAQGACDADAFADPQLLSAAKLAVLIGSGVSALAAFVIGRLTLRMKPVER